MTPTTPLTFEILLTLAAEPRHGYGIIKDIDERSGPEAAPSTGALYLALQRMQGDGLIEDAPEARALGEDARRRYYRLTEEGRALAARESRRLAGLVEAARRTRLLEDPA